MTTELLLDFYRRCFPRSVRREEKVRELLALPENVSLTEKAGGEIAGVSVVNGNTVLMLCVLPEYRRQGVGSALLRRSEELARSKGFEELRFFGGPDYIAPGIPMKDGNGEFFTKRGYVHDWGDYECVDMDLRLEDYPEDGPRPGEEIGGVRYRWAGPEDRARAVDCALEGHPSFAKYYENEALYAGGDRERVLLAETDGVVCGALLVGAGKEQENVGSPGCTVVRPGFRRRRIAANLVRAATAWLKEAGLERGFIGYTYTDIVPLYALSGYRVCETYLMGKKKLD